MEEQQLCKVFVAPLQDFVAVITIEIQPSNDFIRDMPILYEYEEGRGEIA